MGVKQDSENYGAAPLAFNQFFPSIIDDESATASTLGYLYIAAVKNKAYDSVELNILLSEPK